MKVLTFFSFNIIFFCAFCVISNAQVLSDGGFEEQSSSELSEPWWIDTDDGSVPSGVTIEVDLGSTEALEGDNCLKIVTTTQDQWIAVGQNLTVEKNTDYIINFYVKADDIIAWDGNPEWAKGYMKVIDDQGNALADPFVPHYWDGEDNSEPWTPGEIVFGAGFDMSVWRDYHYVFNSGENTELYLIIGTYVNNVVTLWIDDFSIDKVESVAFEDNGFEDQSGATITDPWWIDTDDGNPPSGSTIEVELGTGESFEGDNNVKFETTAQDQWIAIGHDLAVEANTDYYVIFHAKGDAILWDNNPEWSKGYMKVIDDQGNALADPSVPHYSDGGEIGEPWAPGEIVFGEEQMMRYWRDYLYKFNSGAGTEVYLQIGTYVNNVITWRLDDFRLFKAISNSTGIKTVTGNIPTEYVLNQNYPNPFNPVTVINYSVPVMATGFENQITLKVYDILGTEVKTLVNEAQAPGNYQVGFDASGLSSGIYLYTLRGNNFIETKKMILIK